MAHFMAPQRPDPELPVFFNVDGVVGAQPAQNKREDVLLVQFAFQVIANAPIATTDPNVLAAAKAVKVTGTIDPATTAAIRAFQTSFKAAYPGTIVDGRVSTAKDYFYGAGIYTIVELNESMQARSLGTWPRIDKIAGCPAELQQLVKRTVAGV